MTTSGRSLLRDWMEAAEKLGWTVTHGGARAGHYRWRAPDGRLAFTPSTPSNGKRSMRNIRSSLRKAGLPI